MFVRQLFFKRLFKNSSLPGRLSVAGRTDETNSQDSKQNRTSQIVAAEALPEPAEYTETGTE